MYAGSLGRLNHSLEELQQVIRSRYLISYKPTLFSRNGEYRTIDINAQKMDANCGCTLPEVTTRPRSLR
jgi:hypothetical protein